MEKKVTKIEAVITTQRKEEIRLKNVCAYVRVSTGSKEQAGSYASQIDYYTKLIDGNPLWNFAGIYADEGITGTKVKGREEFQAMLKKCEEGSIDMIITKSITRFCRNTVDCIKSIRRLKEIGVSVYFEKENINTLDEKSELLLTLLSSLAQAESEDFSGNARWAVLKRFKDGTFIIGMPAYGYVNDEDGNLIPHEKEAEVVRFIFKEYLNGKGTRKIAQKLNEMKIPTIRGAKEWLDEAIVRILKNPIYAGDMLYQKTYTARVFPYKKKKNNGEMDQYFIEDNHPAIIPREQVKAVCEIMKYRREHLHNAGSESENRYFLSGRIVCEECGSHFKRQKIAGKGKNDNIKWGCIQHIRHIENCSVKSIKEAAIQKAFVMMWNKLYTNQEIILQPYVNALRNLPMGSEEQERLGYLENEIDELMKQEHILNQVMVSGYMDPAIFMEKKNEIVCELSSIRRKKATILTNRKAEKELVRTEMLIAMMNEQGRFLAHFDIDLFELAVEKIGIQKDHTIIFYLKNGLSFAERGN